MKKIVKIILIVIIILIGIILLDTLQTLAFNNSHVIKTRENYDGGTVVDIIEN